MPHPTKACARILLVLLYATGARRTEVLADHGGGRIERHAHGDPHPPGQGSEGPRCATLTEVASRSCAAGGAGRSLRATSCPAPRAIGVQTSLSPTRLPWHACHVAATRAGLTKKIHPHTLRHSYATPCFLEAGADLRTIQILMGHERLEDTTVYLQLSRRHLHAAVNPLEQIALPRGRGGQEVMEPAIPSRWPT